MKYVILFKNGILQSSTMKQPLSENCLSKLHKRCSQIETPANKGSVSAFHMKSESCTGDDQGMQRPISTGRYRSTILINNNPIFFVFHYSSILYLQLNISGKTNIKMEGNATMTVEQDPGDSAFRKKAVVNG